MSALTTHKLNVLTLPLNGIQLIEASAGTGKTWTLAALYVRLVLGHGWQGEGLMPPQILVMTFTEAATAELRDRIRARLTQAAQFFSGKVQDTDDFLLHLQASLGTDNNKQHAARLEEAAQWMDEAAIYTIHSWSSRMLRQHAFDSQSLFDQKRLDDAPALKLKLVKDYWREFVYPLQGKQLGAMKDLGATPEALLKNIQPLWQKFEKSPGGFPDVSQDPNPKASFDAWAHWQETCEQFEISARQLLASNMQVALHQMVHALANDLRGNIYLARRHGYFISHLSEWASGEEADIDTLKKFTFEKLNGSLKKEADPIEDPHGIWSAIGQWMSCIDAEPKVGVELLQHAAVKVGRAYLHQKKNLASFDFSDLLQRLHAALHVPGSRLPEIIRAQFPVALVDEFQDTDPWQYESLSRIYGDQSSAAQAQDVPSSAFLMIGDPKQAIYSFRGADLQTYLNARHAAQAIWTLTENFRSSQEVVNAVNHLFGSAKAPFGEVPFEQVQTPTPAKSQSLSFANGQKVPALTVWHLNAEKPLSGTHYGDEMAHICATQMVDLLNQQLSKPGDMAVLVRDGNEAKKIRQALAARGVRSVYLSDRDSVYATREALDLACILEAVLQARNAKLLRAALTTRTLCLSLAEIEQVFNSEDAWDMWVERFNAWRTTWQRQGFLPMLYRMVHEQDIGRRMQVQGDSAERRLTNLLHLGELLQSASLSLQGETSLLRFLTDQLANPQAQGEAAQMRLETDAQLVQVITFHKAKGLQYPLVFLPFVSNFREDKDESLRTPEERLQEDIRLLYVALTRAQQAMWMGVAKRKDDFKAKESSPQSAISVLLGRSSAEDLQEKLQQWATCSDIAVVSAPDANDILYVPPQVPHQNAPTTARQPTRTLPRAGWTASFSALTRNLSDTQLPSSDSGLAREDRWLDSQIDNPVAKPDDLLDVDANTNADAAQPVFNAFPAGSAYGTLLHDIFEWQLKEGWPLLQDDLSVSAETQLRWQRWWQTQADSLQLNPEHQALCLQLIRHCATEPLNPLGLSQLGSDQHCLSLSKLNAQNAWPEMGFTFKTHGVPTHEIDRLISQSLHPDQTRPSLQAQQLNGLLTGFMDIVLEHQGRYYVLDYKSNKLPEYTPDSIMGSLLSHRYDVQYTLYILAVHRLLKSRLKHYDYEQHMGGAIYLYLRGIDQVGQGVYFNKPPFELIQALDDAFKAHHSTALPGVMT
ncbi:exodeoxyribonuclease V subunit beta [Limnohabitans sp. Rim11]|uniref:exodeoxyribonuclease V subunit beta n=1 Tax=Limnohabitans sp. Rim11 TaxID=1100719 RepID=UPI000AE9B2AD|nr:exodeoxyribonuclease V subunit beta [Limnohabitans sp. Rim11]